MKKKADFAGRRKFIKAVGVGMGALGLGGPVASRGGDFRSDWTTAVMSGSGAARKKVVVVGAGISGLVAAYELSRAGIDFVVLEARSRPGGRVETIRAGDAVEETDSLRYCNFDYDESLYFNTGAARIPQHHQGIVSYCHELGIPLEVLVNENRAAYVHSPSAFGPSPVRNGAVHASLRGDIAELLSTAINRGVFGELTEGEQRALLQGLQQFGDLNTDFTYAGSTRAGVVPGTGVFTPAVPVSPLPNRSCFDLDPFMQFTFHIAEYFDQQATMLQPVGGMDNIPEAFARALGARVRYEHEVVRMSRQGSGVTIDYIASGSQVQSLSADYAIVTIPASVLQGVSTDFTPEVDEAIASTHYTSAGKLAFQAPRFWESNDNIYGGISWTEEDVTQLWYPSSGFGNREGVLVGAYVFGGARGDEFASMTPEERVNMGLQQGENIHRGLSTYVRNGISRSWPKTPYSLGGWSESLPSPVWQTADGPYIFAGDHTTYLSGWQEGAVASAQRALNTLVSLMSQAA